MSKDLISIELSQLIREISRKIDSILLPISSKNDLTIMKLKVLLEIREKKNSNIGEIGQSLGIAGGNVSNLCKELEKEGYLNRTRNSKDERVVTVNLTDRGLDVVNTIIEQLQERYESYETSSTSIKLTHILNSLKELNGHLDNLVSL